MNADDSISSTRPDWSREKTESFWDPSRKLILSIRDYKRAASSSGLLSPLRKKFAVLRHRFWSVVTGADIPICCDGIEGGLLLPHPTGVVIHPDAVIGPNCMILQQVTIGEASKPGVPRIGGNVDIGAGAKILGNVKVGSHAIIGANAVVVNDVPEWSIVGGVPARVINPDRRKPRSRQVFSRAN